MDQTGVVRSSEGGPANASSPAVSTLILDPSTIHPGGTPSCWTGPYVPTSPPRTPAPTTLQAQADADAQLRDIPVQLLEQIKIDYPGPFTAAAGAMVAVFGQDDPPGLAATLHANIDQALDDVSIAGPDGAFHFEDLLSPPEGNFDALTVIADVENSFGGCAGFCLALGTGGANSPGACTDDIGPIEEPELLLNTYVVTLIDSLDLGIACPRTRSAAAAPRSAELNRRHQLDRVDVVLAHFAPAPVNELTAGQPIGE